MLVLVKYLRNLDIKKFANTVFEKNMEFLIWEEFSDLRT